MNSRRIEATFFTQITYTLKEVLCDLWGKKAGTFLTILAIAASLTIPTVSYLLWKNVSQTAQEIYPQSQMSVYLDKKLDEQQSQSLVNKMKKLPGVGSLDYISRQQSLEDFKSWSGMEAELNAVDSNPLPAVAIITLKPGLDSAQINALQHDVNQLRGVDEVRIDSEWIEKLNAVVWLVGRITFWCALLMGITVLLVIGSNIRSAVYSKREMIEVTKLLGATEHFVLRPFYYSGLILGLIGSFFAVMFSLALMYYFSGAINYVADIFAVKFSVSALSITEILFIMLITAFLGWLASGFAAKRHIRQFES